MLSDSFNHHHRNLPEPSSHDEPSPPPRALTILSHVLEKLVAKNDQLSSCSTLIRGKSLKGFEGVRAPSISIPKYLERIHKYTNCSPSCFVVGYVYIDRLVHKYPDSLVVSLNVHRLLVTSVMVASKMLDDEHCNNAVFARVGGITNSELNKLELELLYLLGFGVGVSSQTFETYCQHLEKEMLRNGTTMECMVRPAITNSSAADAVEISVDDHTPSSSSQDQTVD